VSGGLPWGFSDCCLFFGIDIVLFLKEREAVCFCFGLTWLVSMLRAYCYVLGHHVIPFSYGRRDEHAACFGFEFGFGVIRDITCSLLPINALLHICELS
jgi:hypothetical protein